MGSEPNPLLPATYDIVWSIIVIASVVPLVLALISIARNQRALSATQALIWVLITLFAPVIGPLAWLFIGRRIALREAPNDSVIA